MAEQVRADGCGRRGVENDATAPGLYPAGKGQIGHSRDFLLKNGDGIGGKASFGDVAVGDGGICPGGNHDLIVATLRNRDQRDSGRGVRPLDARDIDARLHQRRQGQVGETVAANGANHLRARTARAAASA